MSFATNNIFVESIGFNGQKVKSLYYNDVLVWGFSWEDSTWEDLYNVCKMKQAGVITEWPENIQIGKFKACETRLNGIDYTWYMRLIGMDIDAPGTLTFETATILDYVDDEHFPNGYAKNAYSCMEYHANLNPKESPYHYIRAIDKQYESVSLESEIRVEKVYTWNLSREELGYKGDDIEKPDVIASGMSKLYTDGVSVPYQYYDIDDLNELYNRRKKYYYEDSPSTVGEEGWWPTEYKLRGYYGNNNGACIISSKGKFVVDGYYMNDNSFAFTIG